MASEVCVGVRFWFYANMIKLIINMFKYMSVWRCHKVSLIIEFAIAWIPMIRIMINSLKLITLFKWIFKCFESTQSMYVNIPILLLLLLLLNDEMNISIDLIILFTYHFRMPQAHFILNSEIISFKFKKKVRTGDVI